MSSKNKLPASELDKLKHVIEVAELHLPDALEGEHYEYKRREDIPEEDSKGWEYYYDKQWRAGACGGFLEPYIICRRLRKDRIIPTDAHAIAFPRRPCWVKTHDGSDWKEAHLLAVGNEYLECRYLVRCKDGSHISCKYCLIMAVEEEA